MPLKSTQIFVYISSLFPFLLNYIRWCIYTAIADQKCFDKYIHPLIFEKSYIL